jgi:hypothetical protein
MAMPDTKDAAGWSGEGWHRRRTRRGQILRVRFSAEELAALDKKARAAGLDRSAFIRQRVAAVQVRAAARAAVSTVDPALVRELARLGNNLNQLARWANTAAGAHDAREILGELRAVHAELRGVLATFTHPSEGA